MTAFNSLLLRSNKLVKRSLKTRHIRYVVCAAALTFLLITTRAPWNTTMTILPFFTPIVPAYPFEKDQTGVNSLLTKENFKKIFEPPLLGGERRCSDSTKILVAINSAAANSPQRQAIRETWSQFVRESNQTSLFFVSIPSDRNLRRQILLENQKHQDIVLFSIQDSYYLLTFKILALLNWANINCPKLAFLLKCDDDFYLDWPNLFEYIAEKNSTDMLYGRVNTYTSVHRNVLSRWFMPESDYPASDYPVYLSGSPLFVSYNLLSKLLEVAGRVKPFYIDDVWITGILREQIPEAKMVAIPNVFGTYSPDDDEFCRPLPALALHRVGPPQMYRFFRYQRWRIVISLLCLLYRPLL